MFAPVSAKHTKSLNLFDTLSVGVDRIQRNFEPMQRQVETGRQTQISDIQAKLIFYSAFVDGKLDVTKSLLSEILRLYFEPGTPEFRHGRCGACRMRLQARSRSSRARITTTSRPAFKSSTA